MTLAIIVGVVVVVFAVWLILVMARRVLRLAVRLALAGVVVLALVLGAVAWWWYGMGSSFSPRENRPATRRANSR
jgi:hypothetical protein